MRPLRTLLLHATPEETATLSYLRGWVRHFLRHPGFDCVPIDIRVKGAARLASWLRIHVDRYDAIVMLHSVFSNACFLDGWLFDAVRTARAPKAFFIGNEYKLMPEKMAFCEKIGVSLLVSQSTSEQIHKLYRDRLGCLVTGIPNTGLDPELFAPTTLLEARPIDLGYRAFDGPAYLGHNERRQIGEYFQAHAARYGLVTDISLDPRDRFAEPEWGAFLNRCKGQLGTEAGGDYFELTDATRHAVNAYLDANPAASDDDLFSRFFASYRDAVPLRILSGRHVEAAATKTVQILFEGRYDGYFQPDVHYLALKKDFSNVDEVVARFRDLAHCRAIVDNAYEVAQQLTYDRLIDRFHESLSPFAS